MRFIELCAGGGGLAYGLSLAGFQPLLLVEKEKTIVPTLQHNRPDWNIVKADIGEVDYSSYRGIELVSAGLPSTPFSRNGKKKGREHEDYLLPEFFEIVEEVRPKAVLIENSSELSTAPRLQTDRDFINSELQRLHYIGYWGILNTKEFGVCQDRRRTFIIGISRKMALSRNYEFPRVKNQTRSLGDVLYNDMKSRGWKGADEWRTQAKGIAPAIVGGSKKLGGADLGPNLVKQAWAELGVDATKIVLDPPSENFEGMPRLTLQMIGRIQGFDEDWEFVGSKNSVFGQLARAVPPFMAQQIGFSIQRVIQA